MTDPTPEPVEAALARVKQVEDDSMADFTDAAEEILDDLKTLAAAVRALRDERDALRERHAGAVEKAIRWTIEQVNRDMAQEGQQCCLSPELALARHHARTATERPPFDGRRVDTAGMTPMGEKK